MDYQWSEAGCFHAGVETFDLLRPGDDELVSKELNPSVKGFSLSRK